MPTTAAEATAAAAAAEVVPTSNNNNNIKNDNDDDKNNDNNNNTKRKLVVNEVEEEDDEGYLPKKKTNIDQDNNQNSNKLKLLTKQHVERYSRQMLVVNGGYGVKGQLKLLNSRVLVVGAGGIGSSALLYLAGAGIGQLGIVDYDTVEVSNLHRQIIHTTTNTTPTTTTTDNSGIGINKAVSARRACLNLNPTIRVEAYQTVLTHDNVISIINNYDLVVDASDNPRTRYLINDACVLLSSSQNNDKPKLSIPLVSASAVGTEGQLTVYNYKNGPCYRCLYPKPPDEAESSSCPSCADAGVIGTVPGLVGVLQAMEVIKILTNTGNPMNDRLLMYDSMQCSFLSIKKPVNKQPNCPLCGLKPTIHTIEDSRDNLMGSRGPSSSIVCETTSTTSNTTCSSTTTTITTMKSIEKSKSLNLSEDVLVTCQQYKQQVRDTNTPHLLLDVRVPTQYEMCSLDGSLNIPLSEIENQINRIEELSSSSADDDGGTTIPIYCICRRGIASSIATSILIKALDSGGNKKDDNNKKKKVHSIRNIVGGLTAWHEEIDPNFPKY